MQDYDLFVAVIDGGSLAAAGRALRLSPAMVSKRLARLEARLGARLIHRTTRRLATTDAGGTFYEDARAVLAASRAAEDRVAGRAGEAAGRLRVSAPTSFGRRHIAPHLAGFLTAYPRIDLELDLADGFVDLIGERIDVAVRIDRIGEGGALIADPLAPNHRLLCAAPAYLRRAGSPATLAALARHRLLAAGNQVPWRLDGPGGPHTVPVASVVRTNSSEVVRELALAGGGIALRSTWDVADALADGTLTRVLPDWRGADDVVIQAVRPRAAYAPAATLAFIAWLRSLYAPVVPWDRPAPIAT